MKYIIPILVVLIAAAFPGYGISVTRDLPASASAGASVSVSLSVDVDENSPPTGIIIKEQVPSGWSVASSTPAGYFNSSKGVVKWVLYGSDVTDRVISYTLVVPQGAAGTYTFSGEVLTLAGTSTTGGEVQLSVSAGTGGGTSSAAGGGAGGGGGGVRELPLKPGLNILTPELMKDVVEYLNLQYKRFYRVPRTLAASLLLTGDVTGKYPAVEYPEVVAILAHQPENLSGDVYEIAAQKALEKYSFAETVVIARGDLEVDAIAAIAYAKERNAPILLTRPEELPEVTLETIKRLSPARITIVGGPVAVSYKVEEQLGELATVERIWGKDRYETALKLAESTASLKASEIIVIADGRNVSVEAAVVANSFGAPVLYVGDALSPGVRGYLEYRKKLDAYRNLLKLVVSGIADEPLKDIEDLWASKLSM